jgi:hypothetical protein
VSVAAKNTCPRSLLIAPEFRGNPGNTGKLITAVVNWLTVPTPGIRVPDRPTNRSEPCDHAYKPVSPVSSGHRYQGFDLLPVELLKQSSPQQIERALGGEGADAGTVSSVSNADDAIARRTCDS